MLKTIRSIEVLIYMLIMAISVRAISHKDWISLALSSILLFLFVVCAFISDMLVKEKEDGLGLHSH